MARCGRMAGWRRVSTTLLGLAAAVMMALPVQATMKFGALQLSGSFETQNLIRHPSLTEVQFVQNRNTFRLRVDWDWLQRGRFVDRFDLPFIKSSKLYLLYRGVYDGFYDLTPGGRQRGITMFDDIVGGPIEGNLAGTCREGDRVTGELLFPCFGTDPQLREGLYSRFDDSDRRARKWENRLWEAYIDFALRDFPVSFRIGRQQVIWGESDQFRLMDIWNPLDLTWHLQQEPFEKIRVPLWLAKGLWDTGTVGPFSNTFVEIVYNPFDFHAGTKVDFLPIPWGPPFPNPLRPGQVQVTPGFPFPLVISPVFDLQGTNFFEGDFDKNPAEASEIGGRVHGVTSQGIEMTVNYLYGRSRSIGAFAGAPFGVDIKQIQFRGLNPFPFEVAPELGTFAGQPVVAADVVAEVRHPYTHIFGFTANYFEGDFTQTVFRMETAYQLGASVQTIDPDKRVFPIDAAGNTVFINIPGQVCTPTNTAGCVRSPLGFDKRNLWSGMIGFDRPTWIRILNPRTTWFLSGQFFWSYVDGAAHNLRAATAFSAGGLPYINNPNAGFYPNVAANGVGVWTTGPFAGIAERFQSSAFAGNEDKVRQWELLSTFAATSFYRGGTIVPFIAMAFDPANVNFLAQLQLEYFYTNDFLITLQQKYYTDFGNDLNQDPWGVGGQLNRRDETGIKLTYQF